MCVCVLSSNNSIVKAINYIVKIRLVLPIYVIDEELSAHIIWLAGWSKENLKESNSFFQIFFILFWFCISYLSYNLYSKNTRRLILITIYELMSNNVYKQCVTFYRTRCKNYNG